MLDWELIKKSGRQIQSILYAMLVASVISTTKSLHGYHQLSPVHHSTNMGAEVIPFQTKSQT